MDRLGYPAATNHPGRMAIRYLQAQSAGKGHQSNAEALARQSRWVEKDMIVAVLKAPIAAHNSEELAMLVRPVGDDFDALTRTFTVLDKLPYASVPLGVRLLVGLTGAVAYFVGPGRAKPLSAQTFDGETLDPRKVAAILVATLELLNKFGTDTERMLAADLGPAAAAAIDAALLDGNAGDENRPASIAYGATTFTSTGATVTQIDADLAQLIRVLTDAGSDLSRARFIMRASTATHIAALRGTGGANAFPSALATGGSILGIPVIVSNNVVASGSPAESSIVLVDAAQLVVGEGDTLVDISKHSDLEMLDNPTNDSVTPTATQMVSLWQSNAAAIRYEKFLNFKMRRPGFVAVLNSVTY